MGLSVFGPHCLSPSPVQFTLSYILCVGGGGQHTKGVHLPKRISSFVSTVFFFFFFCMALPAHIWSQKIVKQIFFITKQKYLYSLKTSTAGRLVCWSISIQHAISFKHALHCMEDMQEICLMCVQITGFASIKYKRNNFRFWSCH